MVKSIEAPPSTPSSPAPPLREAQPGPAPAGQSLMDARRVLFARKYLIISIVVVAVIVSYIYAKTRVPLYEAVATAEIDTSRSQSLGLADIVGSSSENATAQVQTEAFRLTGASLIFRAVAELGMENRGPFPKAFKGVSEPIGEDSLPATTRAAIVGAVAGQLKVSIVPRTNAVRVSYRHPSPLVARDFVNKLLNVFMERGVEDRIFGTNQAAGMLAVQMQDLKDHAADAQGKLAKFQEEHNFVGADEKDNLTTSGLKIINEQLAEAQADQIIKQARVRLIQSGNPELLTSVAPTPTLKTLRDQETSVNVELGQLTSKYGSGYPRVHELQAQLSTLQKEIATESNNVSRRVQEEYQTSSTTVQSLQQRLSDQMQKAFRLNESASQYALLREDAESSRDLYDVLQLKLKESSVSAALNAASINIIDHAVTPPYPVEPNPRRIIMTGGLAGLILAVFVAFLIEALRDTLQTSEDLETFSRFSALGAVPHFESQSLAVTDEVGQRQVPSRLITVTSPDSLAAESFRSVRSSVMLSSADRQNKVLVVTSGFMAEGKSTVSANLAIAFAQRGERVLLVDSDLRRSTLHKVFHLSGLLPGLSNLLSMVNDQDLYLTPVPEVPTLTLLSAGAKPPNPAELLASNRMSELMQRWREEYDHVVIDSAPILMVSDALVVASRADGTLMIVRAGLTRKKAISRAFELLSRSKVRILGAIMNDINLKIENFYTYSSRGYGYKYYAYHGEGDAYAADRDKKKI